MTTQQANPISRSSFAIVANGFADGPAQALRDHLVEQEARVVTVFHPLTREDGTRHLMSEYAAGGSVRTRSVRVPLRAPLSFVADPFVPLRLPTVDVWFGFNPLAAARGLLMRKLGRARRTVLWSVDFVPERFGRTPLTSVYDRLDRRCCIEADARVELSTAARDARNERHRLGRTGAPTYVVPMGAWLDRVPSAPEDGIKERRVVYLGHLVQRQGVALLLDALAELGRRGEAVEADVIGHGPLLPELRAQAARLGIDSVRFHGFIPDHRRVEQLVAGASVAVAPYEPTPDSFTRYADPGKLKTYLAAGLPIVLTDVPPAASELEASAGAEIVPFDASALADAIGRALSNPESWQRRRQSALTYAERFDWDALLGGFLQQLGFAE
jgi:glycosyltransferase involved in cell wall biosynthesis